MALFTQQFGSGEPLIILHGLFGMSDNWLAMGKRLANNHTVHILDLRNHGQSPHYASHTYQDMCNDLLTYFDATDIESAIVLGHSMGGKTAMHLALANPDRIVKLVIVDIAPVSYLRESVSLHAFFIETMLNLDLPTFSSRAEIIASLERRLKDKSLALFLAKNIGRSNNTFYWKCNLPVLKNSLSALHGGMQIQASLAPSQINTLFIRGSNSTYIRTEHESERNTYFPNSTVCSVDNSGHWPHVENPEGFLSTLLPFL